MPGKQQGGAVADQQVLRRHADALGADILDLGPEILRIQGDAVSEDIHHIRVEDAGGEQVERKFPVAVHDGVAGVPSTLITDDDVIGFGEQIDHASLSFVAPVDAHNCTGFHPGILLDDNTCPDRERKKYTLPEAESQKRI